MTNAEDLRSERCDACHAGSPRITSEEEPRLLEVIPDWTVTVANGVPRLERRYRFRHYRQALAFTQHVGEVADQEDHHPVIVTEARSVTVTWWTHAIDGLHRNDFIMAAKNDAAFARIRSEEPESA